MKYLKLYNGVEIPLLGIGTFLVDNGEQTIKTIAHALENNYRLIDTSSRYYNEESIGAALKVSACNRNEVFITTKLKSVNITKEEFIKFVDTSLKKLQTNYIDLFLIHWPCPVDLNKNKEVWSWFEEYYEQGVFRAIGVSNFNLEFLTNLVNRCKIKPMVNQIELHPGFQQEELVQYCQNNEIAVMSYGALMKGEVFNSPFKDTLEKIAQKYNKTIPQIIFRWGIEKNYIMIPKSVTPNRIAENIAVFDFNLTSEEHQLIKKLNQNKNVYLDPKDAMLWIVK